jgi:hypothetical protein
MYSLSWDEEWGPIRVHPLPYRVPLNAGVFAGSEVEGLAVDQFRVADILVRERGDRSWLFASHHFWDVDRQCVVVRVSKAEADDDTFLRGDGALEWETVFETAPCLPVNRGGHAKQLFDLGVRDLLFGGNRIGGRMAWVEGRGLLLAVGDMAFDGWDSDFAVSQDSTMAASGPRNTDLVPGTN